MAKCMRDMVAEARSNVPIISVVEAWNGSKNGDIIIDVREPSELESDGRIDCAMHIPRGLLESRACDQMQTKNAALCEAKDNKKVHLVCASGARAALAASTLRDMGYDATCIDGGLKAWKSADLPLE